MLRDFIVNTSILISSIFIGHQLFNRTLITPFSPGKLRFWYGFGFGILGIVLMDHNIQVTHNVIVDLRFVAIMLAALYGGFFSAMVSTMLILSGRVLLYHYSSVAIISILMVGLGSALITTFRFSLLKKWIYMNLLHLSVSFTAFSILIQDHSLLYSLFLYYAAAYLIGGTIAFYMNRYLRRYTELFKQFEEYSTKDYLTGLNNIRQFDMTLNELGRKAVQFHENLSLISIDIDFFKKINDTYGHLAGDEVLKQLGEILSKNCRSVDIVSRNGGEEFSAMLPDCPVEEAYAVAERIRHAVEKHAFDLPDGSSIHLTISLGIATYPDTTISMDELVKQADDALYKAKQTGRNKVCSMLPINEIICSDTVIS